MARATIASLLKGQAAAVSGHPINEPGGRQKVLDILKRCPLIEGNTEIAKWVVDAGKPRSFSKKQVLITQGDDDDSCFFLLTGKVEILVDKVVRKDIVRAAPEVVGEMSADTPENSRSATVRSKTKSVHALEITGNEFRELQAIFGDFERASHRVIMERGRQGISKSGKGQRSFDWSWIGVSAFAALAIAGISFWAMWAWLDWEMKGILPLAAAVGIAGFLIVILRDPAFGMRRLFGLSIFATLVQLSFSSLPSLTEARAQAAGQEFSWKMSVFDVAGSNWTTAALLFATLCTAVLAYFEMQNAKET